ncbi:MAG: hypothetical protein OER90_08510 [Gemmatimonadota bacterium]|nr:hypothetical protein [Gemmatimonadota bacterium]
MRRMTMALAAVFMMSACSDGTAPGNQPGLSLSFSTRSPAGAPAPGAFASSLADTLDDGQNVLIIDRAEIVFREIELERLNDDCDDGFSSDSSGSSDDDGCEEFEAGPMLVDLPLNGAVETAITIEVPPDIYDEIEFEIHKVSNDDPEDADFRARHPDMVGKSIRVTGTFNGQAFTYETDLDVEQEHDLVPPLVIDESTTMTNVTVLLDLSVWFVDGAGNLLDPRTANKGGLNEGIVKENIKQSVEAFEDDDRDGDDDEDNS